MAEPSASIEVSGLDTIDAALRALPAAMQQTIMAEALQAAGELLEGVVIENIHSRSGDTARSFRVTVDVRPNDVAGRAVVGPTGKRAYVVRFLEFGTKKHPIPKRRPKKGRAGVAFGGHVYRQVKHPGIRPQKPMRSALDSHSAQAIDTFARVAWRGIVDVAAE